MATSLAQQLAKLAVPQTALLNQGSKKRASLLFDPKEAATLTRETIYLIGKDGFDELLSINESFQTFANTLFSDKSKDLERSVETREFNSELNKNLRKFLSLLSPYFLQRCSHKALEWLIHRFHIQEYNIDELILLALPYHETNIFVRVIQIVKLKNNEKWLWLRPLQRPGVHLPNSTLYNHASSDVNFLRLTCDYILKTLKSNHYTNINTLISFYCKTFIGAIDYSKEITEAHITSMMPAIMRSLTSSNNADFASATYMILAKLIAKTPVSKRLLTVFTENIALFKVSTLKMEAALLLIIIYQHQVDYKEITEKAFLSISNTDWFVNVLQELMSSGSKVYALLTVLMTKGLKMAGGENDEKARKLITALLILKIDVMVPELIRSILTIYNPNSNQPEIQSFFMDLMKTLEIQYPNQFDDTINNIMSSKSDELQEKFRLLTKGKLNTLDWCDMLEKLNHPLASIRQESVDILIKNYENYSERSQECFKSMIFNRLHDENVDVIYQCLISDKNLVSKVIKEDNLVEVLNEILLKCLENKETRWKLVIPALDILIPLLNHTNYESFIVILSFLKPKNSLEMKVIDFIKTNKSGTTAKFLNILKNNLTKYKHFEAFLQEDIIAQLCSVNKENLPTVKEIIAVANEISVLNKYTIFKTTLLKVMVYLMPENSSLDISNLILEHLISQNLSKKPHYFEIANKQDLSLDDYLNCLERIIENTKFLQETNEQDNIVLIDFSQDNSQLIKFVINLIDVLTKGLFYKKKYVSIYATALNKFLDRFSKNLTEKAVLLLNIASADADAGFISEELKMRCLLIVQSITEIRQSDLEINEIMVILLLVLLKKCTESRSLNIIFDIILKLTANSNKFTDFLKELLKYKDELLLDNNQLGQILLNINKTNKSFKANSDCLLDIICEDQNNIASYIQATYFDASILQSNIENLAKTSKIAIQILEGTSINLTKTQSQIIQSNINRISPEIAKDIKTTHGYVWQFIEATLSNDRNIILTPSDVKSPSVLVMSMINRDFYANLKTTVQNHLLDCIITISAKSDNPDILSSAARVFKHIDLDSATIIPILTKMRDLQTDKVNSKQKRRVSVIPTVDLLSTEQWRKGVCVLELIQDKKKFSKTINLIPILFSLLKKCLDFDEQSNVEYPKQLILSSILHCCEKNTTDGVPQFSESVFNMSLIVLCMRSSWNPQTHQNTLILLAHCATFSPNQVLQNIMAIFTFVGSSYLRHDDAYSFQIITRIIDTIIPILIKDNTLEQILSVSGVFVDAITDVPEHRRASLYYQFLKKLNSELHVSYFVLLIFRNHVKHANAEKLKASKNPFANMQIVNRLEIAANLLSEFEAKHILNTIDHILKYLSDLPVEKDDNKQDLIITMKNYTTKDFRHYKYTIIQFVANLLSSETFVTKVASLSTDNLMALEPIYKNLIIHALTYIQITSKVSERNSNTPQSQYWKVIVHHSYDILDSVNALLTPQMFLLVIKGLLTHSLPTVRRRALELLNVKLQHNETFFGECEDAEFDEVIVSLVNIIKTIAYDKKTEQQMEQEVIVQTALLSLKLITRLKAENQPEKFVQLLSFITELIKCKGLNGNILASLILCLAELCNQLKMHSISNLNSFMPVVIKTLKAQRNADSPNVLLLSSVTAIQKMMECISLFLTPYLEKIIYELTCLMTHLDSTKGAPIFNKINIIWDRIGTTIQPRVLIPIIEASFNNLIEKKRLKNIEPLMALLGKNIEHYKIAVLGSHVLDLTAFFLNALQFRSTNKNIEESAIVESHVMKVFVVLILKLSERSFRPLFYKLYDWALLCDDKSERAITFYNLTKEISAHLKGLFVLFAGHFLNNSATILDQCNSLKNEQLYFDDTQHNALLLENVLATLNNVFEHDTQKFVNKERFDVLMQPLVDQLENELGGIDALKNRSKVILIPTIVHFAIATRDDSLWKQLNYQICLKMRNGDAAIRIIAVECLTEMVKKIGDDFLPLLPETIPFLAELLEDEVEEVEKVTQKSIQEMEGILGEPLQKYF